MINYDLLTNIKLDSNNITWEKKSTITHWKFYHRPFKKKILSLTVSLEIYE